MSGLTFLSWVREGLAAAGGATDPTSGPMASRTEVTLRPRLTGRDSVAVPARLLGPGDVTGLDAGQVLRVFPAAEAADAEPHLFPAVEFDRPDLPWLFTPAGATELGRLRPWLVLVVAEADHAEVLPSDGALPRLRCRRSELPDLAESWAWAHAQVATDEGADEAEVDRILAEEPDRTLSRLLCPRRLRPRTRYVAAVVPAFDAGRLAGLGHPVPEGALRPAWPAAGEQPEVTEWLLPVYHHWRFTTGLDGDFESLVRALTPRALPGDVGTRPVDVGAAGGGLPEPPSGHPGRVLDLEGALRTAGTDPHPWHAETAAAFRTAYKAALDPGPLNTALTPPVYGSAQAGTAGLPSAQAGPTWLRELNLDPRHRAAAALGAEVVRRNQEDLVAAAWDQAAELRRANEVLRQGQLARTVAESLHRRLPGATPGTVPAGDDRLAARMLQMTSAVRDAVGYGDGTAAGELGRNKEADAAMDPAFRRLLRPGGPVARRAAASGTAPAAGDSAATGLAASLARRTEAAVPPLPTPAGLTGVDNLSGHETFEQLRADRLTTRWWEKDPTEPKEDVAPAVPVVRWVGAAIPNRVFVVTEDGRLMSRVTQQNVPGWVDHGFPPGTTCASPPSAVRDLHVFVVGANGNLYQLRWDGDQWLWLHHGMPYEHSTGYTRPVVTGEGRLATIARFEPADGVGQSGYVDQAAYVVDDRGRLWELNGRGTTWSWRSHGIPGGTGIAGLRVQGAWELLLVETTPAGAPADQPVGSLIRYRHNGAQWVQEDMTGVRPAAGGRGFDPARGVPVRNSDGSYLGMGVDNRLYLSWWLGGVHLVWMPVNDLPPLSRVLGLGGDGSAVFSDSTSRVLAIPSATGVPGDGRVPCGPDQGVQGAPYGNLIHVVADGQLIVVDRAGDNDWYQLGRPEFGGKGDPAARPPAHIRWSPRLGFLSNLLVGHVDVQSGPNVPYLRVGRGTDFDGSVRGGWQLKPGMAGRMSAEDTQGFGIATADLDNSGRPDVAVFWIEKFSNNGHVGNFGRYMIGRDLDTDGNAARWIPPVAMPTPMSTAMTASGGLSTPVSVLAGSCTLADLDGDGNQELIVAYLGGINGNKRLFLRIGWNISPENGVARGGWSDSVELPWPGRPDESAPVVCGLDVAVADLDHDLRPELIVMLAEKTAAGVKVSYRVGWDINARGRVEPNAWGPVVQVPGTVPAAAGAAIAVADFSGTEKPDLVVLVLEDGPTTNSATYRIGWDVDGGDGSPRSWSAPFAADTGGSYGWTNQGAGVALVDLPGTVAERRRKITSDFRTAAQAHQNALLAAQGRALQETEPALPLRQLAGAVREATEPETAVTARVAARIDGADLAGSGLPDPLGPLLAPPSFAQPMAELLTELGSDHLLPGVQNVPADTVTLLRANGRFIESFLAGANHELGRELLWREYPTDRRATAFRYFWDARGTVEPGLEQPDVPPMRDWGRHSSLGETVRRPAGGDDAVVLLVRGEVVRRFPSLGLHARRALPSAVPGGPRRLGERRLEPVFSGEIGADVLFFGFPLTVAESLGSETDPGWFFVFEEHATAPSFGLDEPPRDAVYGPSFSTWRDVDWAKTVRSAEELAALTHVGTRPAFGADPRPLHPGPGAPRLSWGRNAAALAHITLQRPVRVAHHASALLPLHGPGLRITHVRKRAPGSDGVFVREIAGRRPDGRWWRMSRAEALTALDGRQALYVEQTPGTRAAVLAVPDGSGDRYLRTTPNADAADNLLSLPTIPPEAYEVPVAYPPQGASS
ncbi:MULTISPECIES: DUF3892 domain-containing protein [Streptomyces]|uniref:FG-GAP repeat protein n=1 Tax=Streptomyces viridochromogenes TaxID=1938 RepID=A0A0L8LET4_STRVR|nr:MULTISPECIES: DUF3892 domain-containing protein [Streptomyces]KOG36758.1 hypothetical protein ADK34_00575 [Streptomyces viridochromogenes]